MNDGIVGKSSASGEGNRWADGVVLKLDDCNHFEAGDNASVKQRLDDIFEGKEPKVTLRHQTIFNIPKR